jgi:acyl transferase domain-containing protein
VTGEDRHAERYRIVALSARTPEALADMRRAVADHLAGGTSDLDDVVWTLAAGRERFRYRAAAVGLDAAALVAELSGEADGEGLPASGFAAGRATPADASVAFVFDGAIDARSDHGLGAYRAHPEVRRWVDRASEVVGNDLAALLAEPEGAVPPGAVIAVGLGVARQLEAWGVAPDAVYGRGAGEITAAVAQRTIEFDEALRAATRRADAGTRSEGQLPAVDAVAGGPAVVVEVGASWELAAALDQALDDAAVMSTSDPVMDGALALAMTVADLWCQGLELDVALGRPGRRTHLPPYAFQRPGWRPPAPPQRRAVARAWRRAFGATPGDDAVAAPVADDASAPFRLRRELRRELGSAPETGALRADPRFAAVVAATEATAREARTEERARGETAPLTPLQQRVLFQELVRRVPSDEHNLIAAHDLPGALDAVAMSAAFEHVQWRRAGLRTVFRQDGERWVSVIQSRPLASLAVHDSSAADAADEVARRPFDVVDAPLVRAALVRGEHDVLVVVLHRALADALGPEMVLAEMLEAYGPVEGVRGPASPHGRAS